MLKITEEGEGMEKETFVYSLLSQAAAFLRA